MFPFWNVQSTIKFVVHNVLHLQRNNIKLDWAWSTSPKSGGHGFESHQGQSFFLSIVWSNHISLLKGNTQFEIKKFPSSSAQDELISLEVILESIQEKVHVLKCDVTNMWEFFTMFFKVFQQIQYFYKFSFYDVAP